MAFKRRAVPTAAPDDPVELYRILSESNSGPAALWLHQGGAGLSLAMGKMGGKALENIVKNEGGALVHRVRHLRADGDFGDIKKMGKVQKFIPTRLRRKYDNAISMLNGYIGTVFDNTAEMFTG